MQLLLWAAGRGRQGNSLVKKMRIRKQQENCVEIKEAGEKESREEGRERKGGRKRKELVEERREESGRVWKAARIIRTIMEMEMKMA